MNISHTANEIYANCKVRTKSGYCGEVREDCSMWQLFDSIIYSGIKELDL